MGNVLNFINFVLSITIVFFSILGFSSLIKNFSYKDFFIKFLFGYFIIGFVTLFIHFFYPINNYISIFLISIGLILFFINFNGFNKKELLILLLIYLISSVLLLSYSNHPSDTNMYHHPFVSYLNSEKIIFGVANIQFRFGHISFLQYVQAALVNDYLHILNLSMPNIILFVSFLYFCGKYIFETREVNFTLLLVIIISSFLLIKYGRYGEFGNDIIPFLISSYALIKIVEEILLGEKVTNKLLNLFPLYTIFIFSHKISYIFSALIFLTIINLKNLNLKNLNLKLIFIFFLFSFLWLSKNFINTSCFAYPLVESCIKSTEWQLTGLSSPESVAWLTEIWSKDFITNPNWQNIPLSEYAQNFNWVENWFKNHFIKILEKLSPIFILLIFIFSIGLIFKDKNSLKIKDKRIYFLLLLCLIGCLIWFVNSPVFRYGSFYLVSSLSIFSILIYNKFFGFNKNLKLNYLNFLFIISLIFFVGKNLDRIFKSNLNFFPESILIINKDKKNYELYGNSEIEILMPNKLCFYSYYLCSHEVKKNIKVLKFRNYFITKY